MPSFVFPNSIIVLDGDVKNEKKQINVVKKLKNIILLPTNKSPEQLISEFLNVLSDNNPLWENIDVNFGHQYCFQDYSNDEIQNDRDKAKKWFNKHITIWGRNASKVLNPWKQENIELVNEFNRNFVETYNEFARKLGLNEL